MVQGSDMGSDRLNECKKEFTVLGGSEVFQGVSRGSRCVKQWWPVLIGSDDFYPFFFHKFSLI